MTIINTDIELIQHLDFDPAIPCEGLNDNKNEAEWRLLKSCGCVFLLCNNCMEEVKASVANNPDKRFDCGKCQFTDTRRGSVISWERL